MSHVDTDEGADRGTDRGADADAEQQARADICRVGRSLFDRGYVHATAGNISVRLANGHTLITPTDACLGFLKPQDPVLVDAAGQSLGSQAASKTLGLHRRLQAADDDAVCIIHTHSTHAVLWTLLLAAGAVKTAGKSAVPPITPYFVMKVGPVVHLPYRRPGDPQVAEMAVQAIAEQRQRGAPIRALLLDRLGPVVWHRTPAAAMAVLEELEETLKLLCQLHASANPVQALSAAAIAELKQTFGARW